MSAIRLMRRMDAAGLIRWFPEEGAPVVTIEGGRFVRNWSAGVQWEDEHSIWWKSNPDDNCVMGTNKKAVDLVMQALR